MDIDKGMVLDIDTNLKLHRRGLEVLRTPGPRFKTSSLSRVVVVSSTCRISSFRFWTGFRDMGVFRACRFSVLLPRQGSAGRYVRRTGEERAMREELPSRLGEAA